MNAVVGEEFELNSDGTPAKDNRSLRSTIEPSEGARDRALLF